MNKEINTIANLKNAIKSSRENLVARFLLNTISSTPFIGGVFSATAGLWSEKEQSKANQALLELVESANIKVDKAENSFKQKDDKNNLVAGLVKFKTNGTVSIIKSKNVSSISDGGTEFTVNFANSMNDYVFNIYGSSEVKIASCHESADTFTMRFNEPIPEEITIVFFKYAN
jgi:hypothetical protein|tara:strand:+ start:1683 stop:2201 length:519 start_codon:yes stop_codon:yes gene_type:complete